MTSQITQYYINTAQSVSVCAACLRHTGHLFQIEA